MLKSHSVLSISLFLFVYDVSIKNIIFFLIYGKYKFISNYKQTRNNKHFVNLHINIHHLLEKPHLFKALFMEGCI